MIGREWSCKPQTLPTDMAMSVLHPTSRHRVWQLVLHWSKPVLGPETSAKRWLTWEEDTSHKEPRLLSLQVESVRSSASWKRPSPTTSTRFLTPSPQVSAQIPTGTLKYHGTPLTVLFHGKIRGTSMNSVSCTRAFVRIKVKGMFRS